jgi:aminoglycoside phosphotransferase (APT) family kinase protein
MTRDSGLGEVRARYALGRADLDARVPLVRVSSVTNEVWVTDDHVVRVSRRLGARLRREAAIAAHLPPEVRYPEVVAAGSGEGFDWMVVRRSPGELLARRWPTMTLDQRREAVADVAAALRALHSTAPPPHLMPLDDGPQLVRTGTAMGADAVAPVLTAIERSRRLDQLDHRVLRNLERFVVAAADALTPFPDATLVHGDLTFENVLWDRATGRVSAIIDFEYARGAPPDLELDVLLRFCAYPAAHVAADYERETRALDYEEVIAWLRADHPDLFASPQLVDRLRVYAIGFALHALSLSPRQSARRTKLHPLHPVRQLTALADRTSHVDSLLLG